MDRSEAKEDAERAIAERQKTELERLREEVEFLRTCGIVEIAVRNQNVYDYMKHWEGRAEKAEARVKYLEDVYINPDV